MKATIVMETPNLFLNPAGLKYSNKNKLHLLQASIQCKKQWKKKKLKPNNRQINYKAPDVEFQYLGL